ncbi:unnamed protein product, partial [Musa banksii]
KKKADVENEIGRGYRGKIEEGFGRTPSSDLWIKTFKRSTCHTLRCLYCAEAVESYSEL